jgi:hypothetical protein
MILVPKGGSGDKAEDYIPVAVLSTPEKVFESAIHKRVEQVSAQIADAQHGFRLIRSTASNLLSYVAQIISIIDSGVQADTADFDFKQALDLVDNDMLII